MISGVTAANKVYDGSTEATVETGGVVYTGLVGNEKVIVSSVTGTFADKNVGNGKEVTLVSQYKGVGVDVNNYAITDQQNTLANITAAPLAISGITAANKVYDGSTATTVDTTGVVFTGLLGRDEVTVSGATGTFVNPNEGTGKLVNLNYALGGDALNYDYTNSKQLIATADIISTSAAGAKASVTEVNEVTKASFRTASIDDLIRNGNALDIGLSAPGIDNIVDTGIRMPNTAASGVPSVPTTDDEVKNSIN
jgi:hypothetical protein